MSRIIKFGIKWVNLDHVITIEIARRIARNIDRSIDDEWFEVQLYLTNGLYICEDYETMKDAEHRIEELLAEINHD